MEKRSLVPSLAHKVFQKMVKELSISIRHNSLRQTIKPYNFSKKILEMWLATLWHGMKCAILLNLSTTTKIEFIPLWVLGSSRTKSKVISTKGVDGMGKGVHSPWGITLDLACKKATHLVQYLWTSFFIWGRKNFSLRKTRVLLIPKCPISPPSWLSLTSNFLMDPWGIQSFPSLNKYPLAM